jgi:aldehyde:ferredoxin oxidoreductase
MRRGYTGKILWVDLGKRTFTEEQLDDCLYELFLGGYGLAAKIIFDRQKPGLERFHPDNILAVMSGLLTNGRAAFNGRWMLAGKSPLTGTWGDSNCGGNFAPIIKQAGYDGIFIVGKSDSPVYILIDEERKEIVDASEIWGSMDAIETELHLQQVHGADYRVISIGSGGENLSLISGVVNERGRLAGRSGFGSMMGAKKLKAICAYGSQDIEVYDASQVWSHTTGLLKGLVTDLNDFGQVMKNCGTAGTLTDSAESGDSPLKNWLGVGAEDFPTDRANLINAFEVTKYEVKKYYCYGCPFGCGGICHVPGKPLLKETHRPEYETICGFGAQLLNDDLESIFLVNEMCNRAGIDTISCATTVEWAFEAFDRGLLTEKETGGLRLVWGHGDTVVELVRRITRNEGFGEVLKDGVREAVNKLGLEHSEAAAMHVHGQELPMHDSRSPDGGLGLGIGYEVEPTPGRHTSTFPGIDDYTDKPEACRANPLAKLKFQPRYLLSGQAQKEDLGTKLRNASCAEDIVNALGLCNFGFYLGPKVPFVEWTNATTGWMHSLDDLLRIGQRIKTVRHAFNIREGVDVAAIKMPDRARGNPPLKEGPNAYSANVLKWDDAKKLYYQSMGWDEGTAVPLESTLDDLDLPEVKRQLYG